MFAGLRRRSIEKLLAEEEEKDKPGYGRD